MGVNKVILLGNLGADPETRMTPSQTQVCNLRIATGERRKDASGNWVDHTEWHRVVAFGRTAENCSQYLKKGRQVYVEGRIQTKKWQDRDGKDRYTTEIIADNIQFVGGTGGARREQESPAYIEEGPPSSGAMVAPQVAASATGAAAGGSDITFTDDDIPF